MPSSCLFNEKKRKKKKKSLYKYTYYHKNLEIDWVNYTFQWSIIIRVSLCP